MFQSLLHAVFRLTMATLLILGGVSAAVAQARSDAAREPEGKALAVLLFRELSGAPENDYLGEAVSDELGEMLGRVPGLRVVSSASAFSFQGKARTPAEIATRLGVDFLVEGTVSRNGALVRVNATLIDARNEGRRWSLEARDAPLEELAAVRPEIAAAIARHLQLPAPAGPRRPSVPVKPEAYRFFVEGRRAWNLRPARDSVLHAKASFEKAAALDPTFARAYAALAEVSASSSLGGDATFGGRHATGRFAPARTAVELAPDSAEVRTAHATVLWYAWQIPAAEAEARRALRLNPSYAGAHHVLARVLALEGRLAESLAAAEFVTKLDPLSPRLGINHCALLLVSGRPAEALAQADRALALQPEAREALVDRMRALSALGRHDEAVAIALRPRIATTGAAVIALVHAGRKAEAAKAAEALPGRRLGHVVPLAALGRTEEALEALDADATQAWAVDGLFYAAELDAIRDDPRFVRYIEKLGLTEAHRRAQEERKRNGRGG